MYVGPSVELEGVEHQQQGNGGVLEEFKQQHLKAICGHGRQAGDSVEEETSVRARDR